MAFRCKIGVHDFSWEYESTTSCTQVGTCSRGCGKTSGREVHIYGPLQYVADGECERVSVCERNAEHTVSDTEHEWGRPHYVRDGDCERTAECARNPEHVRASVEHLWGPTKRSKHGSLCVLEQRCTRCPDGVREVDGDPHVYSRTPVWKSDEGWNMHKCVDCIDFRRHYPGPADAITSMRWEGSD
jgi:hypothetical protein